MTAVERDWEASARNRLRRYTENMVTRMRSVADQIERESARGLDDAAKPVRDREYHTYSRVSSAAIDAMHSLMINVQFSGMVDAATSADIARQEKMAPAVMGEAQAKTAALVAMLDTLHGWIEGAQENHEASGHRYEDLGDECWRKYAPEDIRAMVNNAARELGLPPFPTPSVRQEDVK